MMMNGMSLHPYTKGAPIGRQISISFGYSAYFNSRNHLTLKQALPPRAESKKTANLGQKQLHKRMKGLECPMN